MITRRDTLAAWLDPTVTVHAISKRFHNILLAMPNPDIGKLIRLLQLFAEEPPPGRGQYNHHDGWRS